MGKKQLSRQRRRGGSAKASAPVSPLPQTTIDEIFQTGVRFQSLGHLEQATARYQQVLQHQPTHVHALNNMGIVLQDQGALAEAREYFQRALILRPDFVEAMNNLATLLNQQGQPDAALTLWQRALFTRPDYLEALYNAGCLLLSRGEWALAREMLTRAEQQAPDHPDILMQLGRVHWQQGQLDQAIHTWQRCLALQPHHVALLNLLGMAWDARGDGDRAMACLQKALQLEPNTPELHNNCGNLLQKRLQPEPALAHYREALRLKPDYGDAWSNLGGCLHQLGRLPEALEALQRAQAIQPHAPSAHYNESLIRLLMGDYPLGWQKWAWRWQSRDIAPHPHPQPLWDGTPIPGKTLLLHCEQGYGDSLQMIRYLPLVKPRVGRLVLLAPPPLQRLFASLPECDALPGPADPIPPCDYQLPLMSLPQVMRTTLDTIPGRIPYLTPDPDLTAAFRERLRFANTPTIGIAWRGNPNQKNDGNRSLELETLIPLLELTGVTFVSLQKDITPSERHLLSRYPHIMDCSGELSDFASTAALIQPLDLVIAVDSAVIHLTGALGRPGWVLLAAVPDWRWLLNRSDSPWYPTLRLIRQQRAKQWGSVMETVVNELKERTMPAKTDQ